MYRPQQVFTAYGFGAAPTDDADYIAAWTAFNSVQALPNFNTLSQDLGFANIYNNLLNTLQAIASGTLTVDSQRGGLQGWTSYLNGLIYPVNTDPPIYPIDPQPQASLSLAEQHPDIAAIVEHFYQRYLHGASDTEGLNFWVGVVLNDGNVGLAHAENGFRVSAVEAGLYTNDSLPAPEYFTLTTSSDTGAGNAGGNGSNAGSGSGADTGSTGGSSATGGSSKPDTGGDQRSFQETALTRIEDAVIGVVDKISASTGLSKRTIEIGGVAAVVLGLYVMNSGGTSRRR